MTSKGSSRTGEVFCAVAEEGLPSVNLEQVKHGQCRE